MQDGSYAFLVTLLALLLVSLSARRSRTVISLVTTVHIADRTVTFIRRFAAPRSSPSRWPWRHG